MNHLFRIITIGVLATAAMDVWGIVRQPLLGYPRLNLKLVGRWFAYMPRGKFRHNPITASLPLRGEWLVGLAGHYLIGIAFAALLVVSAGTDWLHRPTIGPALILGVATVAAPLFLMQPAMGAGIASSRASRPVAARIQSIVSHSVFGLGLYGAGWLTQWLGVRLS